MLPRADEAAHSEAMRRKEDEERHANIVAGKYELVQIPPGLLAEMQNTLEEEVIESTCRVDVGVDDGVSMSDEMENKTNFDDEPSMVLSAIRQDTPEDKEDIPVFNPKDSGYQSLLFQTTQPVVSVVSPVSFTEGDAEQSTVLVNKTTTSYPTGRYSTEEKGKGKAIISDVMEYGNEGNWIPSRVVGASGRLNHIGSFLEEEWAEEEWDGTRGGFKPDLEISIGDSSHRPKEEAFLVDEITTLHDEDSNTEQIHQKTDDTIEQHVSVIQDTSQFHDSAPLSEGSGVVDLATEVSPPTILQGKIEENKANLDLIITENHAWDHSKTMVDESSANKEIITYSLIAPTNDHEEDTQHDTTTSSPDLSTISDTTSEASVEVFIDPRIYSQGATYVDYKREFNAKYKGSITNPCPAVNKDLGCPEEEDGICPYHHRNKGILCKSFREGKTCSRGDKCAFLHKMPPPEKDPRLRDLKLILDEVLKTPSKYKVCSYVNGVQGCWQGQKMCRFNHSLEGVLCPDDGGKGVCPRQSNCPLRHRVPCQVYAVKKECECASDEQYIHPPEKWQPKPKPKPLPPQAVPQQTSSNQRTHALPQQDPHHKQHPIITQSTLGAGAGSKLLHSTATQNDISAPAESGSKRQRKDRQLSGFEAPKAPRTMLASINTALQRAPASQGNRQMQSVTHTAHVPTGPRVIQQQPLQHQGFQQQPSQNILRPQSLGRIMQAQNTTQAQQDSSSSGQGDLFSFAGAAARPQTTSQQRHPQPRANQPSQDIQRQYSSEPRGNNQRKRKFTDDANAQVAMEDEDRNPFGPKRMKQIKVDAGPSHPNHGSSRGRTENNSSDNSHNGRRTRGRGRGRGRRG
ncbi:hypothetical protein N0V83_000580 [Neocucurbitaria cava]|uniref:C3H1-type domain-containing protein n=1 Tax=Neocucurbitaria cava TaxID=798079 RepID=A0A9W9CR92_9PLEO|nr:hypothetical protein N0V83_000580 [Neocucurbitaria cava]